MTHRKPIEEAVADWDPFEEDPCNLCDILEMEAGMAVQAFGGGDASMGFGRVYAAGCSPRLSRLLASWGWMRLPEEERASSVPADLCIDVPLGLTAEYGLCARALVGKMFAGTLNETFSKGDGRFLARPVSVVLVNVRNGGMEGYTRRRGADVLRADPLADWSQREVLRRLFGLSVASLSASICGRLQAARVQHEMACRLKRLEDVREVAGLDLATIPEPSPSTIRRWLRRGSP